MIIQLTPRNIAYVLFKRKKAIIGFFVACLLLNAAYIFLAPWKYESDAQVMVKVNFNNPELARADFGNGTGGSGGQAPQISDDVIKAVVVSYKAMASSQDVERATLNKVTVERMYPSLVGKKSMFGGTPMDKAIEKFDDDLDVSQLKESNIIQIAVFNRDPVVAQDAARILLTEFITMQQSVFRAPATSFLEGQLAVARERVQKEDELLRDFKVAHQLSNIADERTQLLQQRTDTADNLDVARSALSSSLARKETLESSMTHFESNATLSSGTDAMSHQLDDAQARLTAQLERQSAAHTTYPADSPFVKAADTAVADARKRLQDIQHEIGQTVRAGASPVYQALQTDALRNDASVSGAQAQVSAISKDIDLINARLSELARLEGQLRELEIATQVAHENLTTQMQRVTESRISTDLNKSQITSLTIVQQPTLGYKIVRPRWKLSSALALLFGLFGGIGFAFMRESMSETFGLPEQLEEVIRVPVLATFNHVPSQAN